MPKSRSYFLSDDEVEAMKQMVEGARKRKGKEVESIESEDWMEQGMKVPKLALDACHQSFRAADESRAKASATLFSDTGLMALICRHNRVLWMVSLTSAGEKQYYALALLQRLFQGLPAHWTCGVLYDVGCQVDRSIKKVMHHSTHPRSIRPNPVSHGFI
jgi:hypothetical protein